MDVENRWIDGRWWVCFPKVTFMRGRHKAILGGPETSMLMIPYETLCAAFPGFKEIYTPEPDEPQEDGQ